MSRLLALLVILVMPLTTGYSAPRTKSSVASDPPAVGDSWVILHRYGDFSFEETREVTAVEEKDGALLVTQIGNLKKIKGPGKVVLTKESDTGTYLLQEGEHRYDPPIRLMPKPTAQVKEGETWKWEKPPSTKWTFTAGKEEEVEVPAGKFKARRIEGEGQSEGKPVKCTQWIAPGRPTIKTVIRIGDDEIVEVLKSFTPGKK